MNLLRRSGYPALSGVLLDVLDQPGEKERFRSFVIQHLGHELAGCKDADRRERMVSRLRKALADDQDAVRREAVLALAEAKDPSVDRMLDAGLSAPAQACMRDLVIRLLLERDRREALPAIRSLTKDADEATRIAAIHALGKWRDEVSRPLLVAALASAHERTRRAAELALRALDGAEEASPVR